MRDLSWVTRHGGGRSKIYLPGALARAGHRDFKCQEEMELLPQKKRKELQGEDLGGANKTHFLMRKRQAFVGLYLRFRGAQGTSRSWKFLF